MRITTLSIITLVTGMFCIIASDAYARGGGGRAGGGGGRVGGGAGRYDAGARVTPAARADYNHVPTMSRATTDYRATNSVMSAPRAGSSLSGGYAGSAASRSQLQQFMSASPAKGALDQSTLRNSTVTGNQIRQGINQAYPNRRDWFGNQFLANHNINPAVAGALTGAAVANRWDGATWGTLGSWYGWGGDIPPLYYQDGYAYSLGVDGTLTTAPAATTQTSNSYAVAQPVAQPVAAAQAPTTDTLSLGVFALTNSQIAETQPSMYFQISVAKDGTLSGYYYNQPTDQVYPLSGAVDTSSQKAVWKMNQGDNSPVFETGLYNLTLQQTPVQVNFGNQTQQWFLVKMNQS